MRVLMTGGAGYVGSHLLLQLLGARHDVLVFDNFSTGSREALRRVKLLTNADFDICAGDIRHSDMLAQAFGDFRPDAVIHLAGLKAVAESDANPLECYLQNVAGSIEVLKEMQRHDCRRMVFSSSATVYGEAVYLPCDENHPLRPTNPYGRAKFFIEEIIRDWVKAAAGSSAVLLRYFNPVGADSSGRIGEDLQGLPVNLVPFISKVAIGALPELRVFGDDYETRDGTCERDFVHVEDLAQAHLAALDYVAGNVGCEAINIGTGSGATVLEMVDAFKKASGRPIPYTVGPRRQGDIVRSVAAADKAQTLLGWKAEHDILEMCESAWRWQSCNPRGYADPE